MPKAKKSGTRAASARSDPLMKFDANARQKAPARISKANKTAASADQENAATGVESPNNEAQEENTFNASSPHAPAAEPNYLLMIAMICSSDPVIKRILSVPPNITFSKLHSALQVAFGWTNSHMHTFSVTLDTERIHPSKPGKTFSWPRPVLELSIHPNETEGLVVHDEKLWTLKDVYEKKEFECESLEGKKETLHVKEPGTLKINYTYDMGDSWEHEIILLGRADGGLARSLCGPGLKEEEVPQVLCLMGEGHPCAEDCGGEPGWEDLKAAFKKKSRKGEERERVEWYKARCLNRGEKGLDPYSWDILEVNDELQKIKV